MKLVWTRGHVSYACVCIHTCISRICVYGHAYIHYTVSHLDDDEDDEDVRLRRLREKRKADHAAAGTLA